MVTIRDVAALAGVSLMTVSRVIRSPGLVAAKTRSQVQKAIDQLNYIPDQSAGSLSSRKSNTVLVVLPSLHFEGHIATVDGLSSRLRQNGFNLLIADNFNSHGGEMEVLRLILGRRPAGIVFVNSSYSVEGRKLLIVSGVPVIETWDFPRQPIDSVVGFVHERVGRALAEHLVEQGYERIGFVGGPADADPKGDERRLGYVAAMKAHGRRSDRVIIVEDEHLTMDAGKAGVEMLLDAYPDTDAAIFLTDRVAMGAMMECRRRGIQVPRDLAIAGHGGFDFSEHLVPALTTTQVDAFRIGVEAAEILIQRSAEGSLSTDASCIDVGFRVVPRESSLRSTVRMTDPSASEQSVA